jgi:hypothetical protein
LSRLWEIDFQFYKKNPVFASFQVKKEENLGSFDCDSPQPPATKVFADSKNGSINVTFGFCLTSDQKRIEKLSNRNRILRCLCQFCKQFNLNLSVEHVCDFVKSCPVRRESQNFWHDNAKNEQQTKL